MQSTDDLHKLIRSLSANEKRYFKVYSSRQNAKDNKNYIDLFDALDKMPEYDEALLKKKLKNSPVVKTLPVIKNYLHSHIMRSMRLYRTDNSIKETILNLMLDVFIYREKGLYEMQMKTLKKAWSIAEKYDVVYLQLQILHQMKLLELHMSKRNANDITKEIHKQEGIVLRRLTEELKLGEIYYELWSQYKVDSLLNDSSAIERYNNFKQSPYMQDYKTVETFNAKWYFLRSYSLISRFNNENTKALEYYRELLKLFEKYPHHKMADQGEYAIALNNFLGALHRAGQHHEFMPVIDRLKEIIPSNATEALNIFNYVSNNTLLYALSTHKYELKDQLFSDIRAGLKEYSSIMKEQVKVGLLYNMCAMAFTISNFKEALDIADEMIDMRAESRRDLQYGVQLFRLIIHFELGNYALLESLIRSTSRSLQKDNVYAAFEKLLTGNLRKLIASLPDKHIDIYNVYYEDLIMLKAANPNYKFVIMSEALAWLHSKINGTDIKTAMVRISAPQSQIS